jgi:hypothetical protein
MFGSGIVWETNLFAAFYIIFIFVSITYVLIEFVSVYEKILWDYYNNMLYIFCSNFEKKILCIKAWFHGRFFSAKCELFRLFLLKSAALEQQLSSLKLQNFCNPIQYNTL